MNRAFHPQDHGFVLLRDFRLLGATDLTVHKHRGHPAVDGSADYLRLNVYMTKDGNYVTIWRGLLEPMGTRMELTTGRLSTVLRPTDLGFLDSYNEDFFRG